MNERQIECFLSVAEYKSFTRAAERLFISQPAISRQISILEQEIGYSLFYRTKKKYTELTAVGELYLQYFSKLRTEWAQLQEKAHQLSGNVTGTLRFGVLAGWNVSSFLPTLLQEFAQVYPNIQVIVSFYDFVSLKSDLRSGALDVVLVIQDTFRHISNIQTRQLTNIQRILLYSNEHAVARAHAVLTPQSFRDTVFLVAEDPNNNSAKLVEEYCAPYGFVPKTQIVPDIESMVAGVQNLMGVAIVDDWSREKENHAFSYIPLHSFNKVILAWQAGSANKLLSLFISEIDRIADFNASERQGE